ncbi:MAG: amidohydrolase family protein, partial [Rhodothermales bacterium]|nr:amidohydrolase family protein [Rhodothermales bacterium]
ARVFEADTLTVYAGFIDALSHAAVPDPDDDSDQGPVDDRSNPSYERAGIRTDRDVRDQVVHDDKSVAAHRKIGFTTVHAAPRGRMLPGRTAVLLLAGDNVGEMTLRTDQAQMFQFTGASGVYPGTPMGIMAQMRQLFREADRRMQVEAMYEQNPAGMSRPPSDAVHDALFPVIGREQPVFVFTDDVLEIHRALDLAGELDFDMVLAGAYEGFDAVDQIVAAGVPVALTVELPDEPDWMDDIKQDSLQYLIDNYDPDTRTATWRDIEAEKHNLEAKQLLARREYLGSPARFADAGIPFAFATKDVDAGDVLDNIREFVKNGLSKDDALAALTVNGAAVLGLSASMGSVERGKMANLVVSDGDLFEEDSHVRMVVVDGRIFEISQKNGGRGGREANGETAGRN